MPARIARQPDLHPMIATLLAVLLSSNAALAEITDVKLDRGGVLQATS